jgi:glutathione synthase/RimK-type ligase-like ATP-grasp enzyme
MILIVTRSEDAHTDLVISELNKRKEPFVRLNTDAPPERCFKTIRFCRNFSASITECNLQELDLQAVHTVWNRRHSKPAPSVEMNAENQKFVDNEYKHFLSGLWYVLRDRFWINGFQATDAAEIKPHQLAVARCIGLEIPRTVMTNDPQEAMAFFDECDEKVIYKTFRQTIRFDQQGNPHGIYTSKVSRADLNSGKDKIALAPCIFQEYVDKRTELRITVIGDKMFPVEIDTRNSLRARDDWRRYDERNTVYRPYVLPQSIQALIQKMMKSLNLVFGCIDMAVTTDNRYVFFEINPMGEWLGFERRTGMPMLAHFIEMLIQGTESYAPSEAPLSTLRVAEATLHVQ